MSAADGERLNAFGRLAGWCARRWRLVVGAWIALFLALIPAAAGLNDRLTPGGFEIAGSSSDTARTTIGEALPGRSPTSLIVVLEGPDRAVLTAAAASVRRAVADPALDGLVNGVVTSAEAPVLRRDDLGLDFVGLELTKGIDDALEGVDDLDAAIQSAVPAGVVARLAGGAAAFRDFNAVNTRDLRVSETIQVPLVLLILLLVLGTVVAAAIPIATTVVALVATLGLLAFVARGIDMSIYVSNVVPLVGIGVAVDYALLIVGRFREESRDGTAAAIAAGRAGASAGRAIFYSGLTVALALAGMLAVGVPIFTAFAIGTVSVVAMAVAIALTLLPAVLGALGPRLERLPAGRRLRRIGRRTPSSAASSRWSAWAELVMRRPWPFLLGACGVMLALAVPALDLRLGSSGVTALPEDVPSRQAAARVAEALGEGYATPHTVVVDGRASTAPSPEAIAALKAAIAREREFAGFLPGPGVRLGAAGAERDVVRSRDGRVAVFALVGRNQDDDPASQALVGRIGELAAAEPGLTGTRVSVGGAASQNRDFNRTVAQNLPRMIGLVMLLTFVVLVVLFRSLLLPLKAVAMTLVSSLAAYGVLVMVFQYGWGDHLLGFEHLGHVTAWVPPFLFSILFGLSMDYEVFLLSRVREHRERGADDRAAVAWGLARTGGIITAAAAIMLVVFCSFLTNRLIPLKEASLGLAVAILLDATLVRIVLVPAFMRLAGRWNWWLPAWMERALPDPERSPATRSAESPG